MASHHALHLFLYKKMKSVMRRQYFVTIPNVAGQMFSPRFLRARQLYCKQVRNELRELRFVLALLLENL